MPEDVDPGRWGSVSTSCLTSGIHGVSGFTVELQRSAKRKKKNTV